MRDVFEAVSELLRTEQPGALCTVTDTHGSSPQKLAGKMLVRGDGSIVGTIGGGTIENEVIRTAREVMRTGRPVLYRAHLTRDLAMCCGGRMEVFVEPIAVAPRLLIFGGGHVGRALASVAATAGFSVHVVDERAEFAAQERHPEATVHCAEPLDCLDQLPWGEQTYAVIVTHSHRLDEDLLVRAAEYPSAYLGMIGSRAKVLRFLKRYAARGVDTSAWDHVHAPIGFDLGGRSPGEIAVAVAAELVAVRHGKRGVAPRPLRLTAEDDEAAHRSAG